MTDTQFGELTSDVRHMKTDIQKVCEKLENSATKGDIETIHKRITKYSESCKAQYDKLLYLLLGGAGVAITILLDQVFGFLGS